MRAKNVALLDIGSSKIDLIYGSSRGSSTDVVASSSFAYPGFSNGQFFEVDSLTNIVLDLIEQVESRTGKQLKKLYIAVPGEFTNVEVKKYTDRFNRPRPVVHSDLDRLLERAELSSDTNDYVNINTSLIGFDADSYRPIDARSMDDVVTRSITATVSCIMCARYFVDIFDNILSTTRIREVKYLSASLAEGLYLTSQKERDKGVLLCDIGYLTTTVMYVKGNGLANMCSFSLGGAHIIGDFVMAYNMDFKSADNLYDKVNLKVIPKGFEDYHVTTTAGIQKYSMNDVNNITFDRLDMIVDYIKKCITVFGDDVGQFVPVFFTGGGIATCKGAIEYVAYNVGRKYDIRRPNIAQYNYPWCSSLISSLDMASGIEEESHVINKFVNKLFGGARNG